MDEVFVCGHRVRLHQVEDTACSSPSVSAAAAVVLGEGIDQRLVLFVSPTVDVNELKRHLRAELPLAMLPHNVVTLEALPKRSDGLVDRAKLEAQEAPPSTPWARRTHQRATEVVSQGETIAWSGGAHKAADDVASLHAEEQARLDDSVTARHFEHQTFMNRPHMQKMKQASGFELLTLMLMDWDYYRYLLNDGCIPDSAPVRALSTTIRS